MQRSSSLLIVSIGVLLGGCARSSPVVFVDLDQVLLQSNPPKVGVPVAPSPPEPRPAISATVMGSRALALADPANTPRQSVQEMFRAGQTAALDQLLARLKEINKGIVNDFAIKVGTTRRALPLLR